jgi:hypothetical protein
MLAYSDALLEVEQDLYKPRFHLPVQLLDFLRSLFSKDISARCEMQDRDFEDSFADAYVHFTFRESCWRYFTCMHKKQMFSGNEGVSLSKISLCGKAI